MLTDGGNAIRVDAGRRPLISILKNGSNKAFKADIAGGLAAVAAGSCIGSDVADVECKNSSQTQEEVKDQTYAKPTTSNDGNSQSVPYVVNMEGSADCMKDVAEIAANKATKDVFAANGSDGAFVGSKGAYNGEAFGMDPNTPADLGVGKFGFAANVTVSVGSKQVTKVGKYGGTQMIEDHGIADVNTTSANDTKKDGEPALFESGCEWAFAETRRRRNKLLLKGYTARSDHMHL
ncbi:hypothetical protein Tco_0238675 [Tanacetum coccineum]